MSIEDKRRPRFEFYAESIGYPLKTDNIGYCHPETTRLWRTWNAALDGLEAGHPIMQDLKKIHAALAAYRAQQGEKP